MILRDAVTATLKKRRGAASWRHTGPDALTCQRAQAPPVRMADPERTRG